jgi:hypothetical protein
MIMSWIMNAMSPDMFLDLTGHYLDFARHAETLLGVYL